jgi:ligand-binding SRPBCC domain-containing protein
MRQKFRNLGPCREKSGGGASTPPMAQPKYRFETTDWVPWPAQDVFAFFAQPRNLPRLMPAWQRPRIDALTLAPPPPGPHPTVSGAAGQGSRILLSFRPFPFSPVRMRWLAVIDQFAWGVQFCDLQVSGPFAYWRHCHRVQPEMRAGRSGARIVDVVHYALPFGAAGALANAVAVRSGLAALFAFRQRRLRVLLKGAD